MTSVIETTETPARPPAGTPSAGDLVPGLVWAFRIHPDGSAQELAPDAPIEDRHDGWLWLHFNLADQRSGLWLDEASGLPPQALALLRGTDRHQQVHVADGCIYGVVADLVRALNRVTHQFGHLRFAMTERRMVTARHEAPHATELARQRLRDGHRLKSVAGLLDTVIDHVADAIDGLVDDIGSELDIVVCTQRVGHGFANPLKSGRSCRRDIHALETLSIWRCCSEAHHLATSRFGKSSLAGRYCC